MSAILALILMGVLQGLTEFLPVSSSGHLSLFQYFSKNLDESLSLNIAVHIGTLFTILIYYRKDIIKIIFDLAKKENSSRPEVLQIMVASVPTAIIGLLLKKKMDWVLTNPVVAALCLIITGGVLIASDKISIQRKTTQGFGIDFKQAFIIGVIQGFAVLPGISRSGSTIVGGLFLGMNPGNAARFSFLISLPAIAGAGLLEFLSMESSLSLEEFSLGALVSFFTGLVAISWMVKITQKGRLKPFGYYTIIVALVFLSLYSLGLGRGHF